MAANRSPAFVCSTSAAPSRPAIAASCSPITARTSSTSNRRRRADRALAPPVQRAPQAPDNSALHAYLSSNKRSVSVDLRHARRARVVAWRSRAMQTSCSTRRSATSAVVVRSRVRCAARRVFAHHLVRPERPLRQVTSAPTASATRSIGMVRGIGPEQGSAADAVRLSGADRRRIDGVHRHAGHVIGAELGNRVAAVSSSTPASSKRTCVSPTSARSVRSTPEWWRRAWASTASPRRFRWGSIRAATAGSASPR